MYIRRVEITKNWIDLGVEANLAAALASPPTWAVREFLPSDRDMGGFSLYKVDDRKGALQVACAMSFNLNPKIDSGKVSFISVSTEALVNSNLQIIESDGNLRHKEVDKWHVDVIVNDVDEAVVLAKLFMAGAPISFEGKEIGQAARSAAAAELFSFENIHKIKSENNNPGRALVQFVGENILKVSSQAVATA